MIGIGRCGRHCDRCAFRGLRNRRNCTTAIRIKGYCVNKYCRSRNGDISRDICTRNSNGTCTLVPCAVGRNIRCTRCHRNGCRTGIAAVGIQSGVVVRSISSRIGSRCTAAGSHVRQRMCYTILISSACEIGCNGLCLRDSRTITYTPTAESIGVICSRCCRCSCHISSFQGQYI